MISIRRAATACWVIVWVTAVPERALAQKPEFVAGLADFLAAVAGARGDEGPRVVTALDRLSRAVEEWDRTISQAETHAAGAHVFQQHLSLAGLYLDRGRIQEALREIDAALRLETRRAELHLLHGAVLDAAGNAGQAAAAYRLAWTLAPDDAGHAYRVHQAAGTTDRGRAAAALHAAYVRLAAGAGTASARTVTPPFIRIELLPDTAATAPVFVPARYAGGLAALRRGDYAGAVADWRRAAARDPLVAEPAAAAGSGSPTSSEAFRLRGLAAVATGDYTRAVEHLNDAVRARADNERARLALAAALGVSGLGDAAERALLEATQQMPDSAGARWQLALLYESTQRTGDARRILEAVAPAALAGAGLVHDRVGRLARIDGDFAGALDAFTRAVQVRPNDPGAHKQLARAYHEQDRTDEAFAELVAALSIDPRDGEAHAAVGRIALEADRPGEAVVALRRAVALAPERHDARYALATALQRSGNAAAAARELAVFEQAQRQDTDARRRGMATAVTAAEAAMSQPVGGGR